MQNREELLRLYQEYKEKLETFLHGLEKSDFDLLSMVNYKASPKINNDLDIVFAFSSPPEDQPSNQSRLMGLVDRLREEVILPMDVHGFGTYRTQDLLISEVNRTKGG